MFIKLTQTLRVIGNNDKNSTTYTLNNIYNIQQPSLFNAFTAISKNANQQINKDSLMNDPVGFTKYRKSRKSQITIKSGTEIAVSEVIKLHGSPKMINFDYFILNCTTM